MNINWNRCNFQEFDDDIHFCEGLHSNSDSCHWVRLTLAHVLEMAKMSNIVNDNEESAHDNIIRLLTIIKTSPLPYGKTDSEIAQEYRNWFYNQRLNLTYKEQKFIPENK